MNWEGFGKMIKFCLPRLQLGGVGVGGNSWKSGDKFPENGVGGLQLETRE